MVTPFVGVWIETRSSCFIARSCRVTPFVGVWIETLIGGLFGHHNTVTPFVGVWIETCINLFKDHSFCCHTLRGCVDWNTNLERLTKWRRVTPFVGVWIETFWAMPKGRPPVVTPFVGVWIETVDYVDDFVQMIVTPFVGVWIETYVGESVNRGLAESHPSWVCGLKQGQAALMQGRAASHPSWVCGLKLLVWIKLMLLLRHTLRGCVDWNFYRWWTYTTA